MKILEEDLKKRMGVGVDNASSITSHSNSVSLKARLLPIICSFHKFSAYHPHVPLLEAEACRAPRGFSAQAKGRGRESSENLSGAAQGPASCPGMEIGASVSYIALSVHSTLTPAAAELPFPNANVTLSQSCFSPSVAARCHP